MITTMLAGSPLAGNDFGDTQTDGIAGPLGLLIIVLLVIATVFLIRNMNSRIKRLPESFNKTGSDQPVDDANKAERSEDRVRND